MRTATLVAAMAAVAAVAATPADAATRAPLPRLAKVGNPPATLAPGKPFVLRFRAVNRSRRTSARATLTVRLTGAGKRLGLPGKATVPALKRGRTHRGSRRFVLPGAIAPGSYRVVACLKRSGLRAVCSTAARAFVVPGAAPPVPTQPAPPGPVQPFPPAATPAPAVTIDAPAEGAEDVRARPTFSGTASTTHPRTVSLSIHSGVGTAAPRVQTLDAPVSDTGTWSARPVADLPPGPYTAVALRPNDGGDGGASAERRFAVPAHMLAAGDIAGCTTSGDEATAELLETFSAHVVAPLGDLVYDGASLDVFNRCYGPNWGAQKPRSRPAIGNHEYDVGGPAGYFEYFGELAGTSPGGWYSYDFGGWHVIALNSNCETDATLCTGDGDQANWLRADLAAHPAQCTMAYWHHPRFSSWAETTPRSAVAPLWQILDEAGADLLLTGHAHAYERFAPQDSAGAADPAGMRQFIVGTGGRSHHPLGTVRLNSEARHTGTYGVLDLTLRATGYDWRFRPVAGGTFTDSGSAACV